MQIFTDFKQMFRYVNKIDIKEFSLLNFFRMRAFQELFSSKFMCFFKNKMKEIEHKLELEWLLL